MNNDHYAFDAYSSAYSGSVFESEYEKMPDQRYIPWKFVPLGKLARVKAKITRGKIKDKNQIIFKNDKGTRFDYKYNESDKCYELTLPTSKARDGYQVYALYKKNDSTITTVGKLKIASYPRHDLTVKLVLLKMFHLMVLKLFRIL